MIFNKFAA